MPQRVAFVLAVVITGVISPWLVGDWFEQRRSGAVDAEVSAGDEARGAERGGRLLALRERVRGWRPAGSRDGARPGEGSPSERADAALELAPFPLASNDSRVVEARHVSGGPAPKRFAWPFFGGGGGEVRVPESERSREVVAAAGGRLSAPLAEKGFRLGAPVFLRLFKEERELELWLGPEEGGEFVLFRRYDAAAVAGRPGPKRRDGDGQVPEGFYTLGADSLRPSTRHFLGLDLGYPNAYDRYHSRTGGDILIHGGAGAWGAVALPEEALGEVYAIVEAALRAGRSVPVSVFPFRMGDLRMEREWGRRPEWIDFWTNLKEGYDFFENVKAPPAAGVERGRYVFRLRADPW